MKNKTNNIISHIKWKINSGVYEPSTKLPSENALAIKFDCSRLTARKALQILKEEGIVVSRHGRGYYVSLGQEKLEYKPLHGKKGEKEKFQIVDVLPSLMTIASFKAIDVHIEEAQHDHSFSFMKTQFSESGKAFTVLHSFVNTDLVGEIEMDDIKESLSAFLVKRNVVVRKRVERVLVINAPASISLKLNIRANSLVVAVFSAMYDVDDNMIEFAVRYTLPQEYSDSFTKIY